MNIDIEAFPVDDYIDLCGDNARGKEFLYHRWDVVKFLNQSGVFHDDNGDKAGEPHQRLVRDSVVARGYSSTDVDDATNELVRRICGRLKELGRHDERVPVADRLSRPLCKFARTTLREHTAGLELLAMTPEESEAISPDSAWESRRDFYEPSVEELRIRCARVEPMVTDLLLEHGFTRTHQTPGELTEFKVDIAETKHGARSMYRFGQVRGGLRGTDVDMDFSLVPPGDLITLRFWGPTAGFSREKLGLTWTDTDEKIAGVFVEMLLEAKTLFDNDQTRRCQR